MLADDGFLAGRSAEVLRALNHTKMVMPDLGLRFSMLELTPAAGAAHTVDLQPFVTAGCAINTTGNFEVLKSPVGSAEFCQEYSKNRAAKACAMLKAIAKLNKPQVSYYLMRAVCNVGQVNYLCRTTPKSLCNEALQTFDATMRSAFEECSGLSLSDEQ